MRKTPPKRGKNKKRKCERHIYAKGIWRTEATEMNGKDFIKAEADRNGKVLCVFGMMVRAPVCPECNSDKDMTVKMEGEGWTYHCAKCQRDLSYDELMGGC